ncbi:xylulokinase [Palleronia rufa]|uniref:xylulokinase n=2 Tax=Palleronia rufa TaxID=1530186 RepID=UPI0005606BBD|nr:FGGY family carbohydrate kinase [Palleronia rufa]
MYLGLDLGTSGLKALLCGADQRVLAEARADYRADVPAPGLSEQDPAVWVTATRAAVREVAARAPAIRTDLRAIGLSGQMHGLLALGADDRPLRPAILWNDARGGGWAGAAPRDTLAITGVGPMPSFTAAKLHWLRGAEPAIHAAIATVLLPKDHLRLWLTGDAATDPSDAAGTQLYDQGQGRWSDTMAAAVGLDPSALPPIAGSATVAGRLRRAAAEALDLPCVPVVTGAADTPAGALAVGCTDMRHAMISLGTGALCIAGAEGYVPPADPGLHHFAHALPGRFYRMGAILNAGSALDWAAGVTGQTTATALEALAARGWGGPGRVLALPCLDGTRSPVPAPDARAMVLGLGRDTGPLDLMQAMVEGICLSLAEAHDALARGGPVATPTVIGGGTRSALWLTILATALGRKIAVADGAAGGSALGAVRLAMLGDGIDPADVLTAPATRPVAPDPARAAAMAALRDRYRRAWPLADL